MNYRLPDNLEYIINKLWGQHDIKMYYIYKKEKIRKEEVCSSTKSILTKKEGIF